MGSTCLRIALVHLFPHGTRQCAVIKHLEQTESYQRRVNYGTKCRLPSIYTQRWWWRLTMNVISDVQKYSYWYMCRLQRGYQLHAFFSWHMQNCKKQQKWIATKKREADKQTKNKCIVHNVMNWVMKKKQCLRKGWTLRDHSDLFNLLRWWWKKKNSGFGFDGPTLWALSSSCFGLIFLLYGKCGTAQFI